MKKLLLNKPLWIVIMSLVYMLVMPFGTFDPLKPGFWVAIALAVFTEFFTLGLIRKHQVK